MEGSDDECSDLEFDSDYDDYDNYDNTMDVDNPGSEHTLSPPHNSPDIALHSNNLDTPSSGGMSDPDSTPPSSPSTSQSSNG